MFSIIIHLNCFEESTQLGDRDLNDFLLVMCIDMLYHGGEHCAAKEHKAGLSTIGRLVFLVPTICARLI